MKLFSSKKKRRDPTGTTSSQARPKSRGSVSIATGTQFQQANNYQPEVCDVEVGSAVINNDVIDAYELRVEELGHLMLEQGRHLDQLTDRNRRLSTENIALRGKVSENFTTSMSFCTPETTSPLKSVMNQKKGSIEGQGKMQKQKEQNALLHSQAELLVKELAHSNNQISEMDMTIASLEKELKEIWELSRQLMTEKNALRTNITERNDEIKALKSDVKVLEKLRSQLTSKSDQLLNERLELEEQVVSLGLRVNHCTSQVESLQNQLVVRQNEVDSLMEKCQARERETNAATREARVTKELVSRLEEQAHRAKVRNDQLEAGLKETRNKFEDSQVSNKTLTTTVESLRSELKMSLEKHKEDLSSFTKGQNKILSTLKQKHTSDVHTLEKTVANLQRVNSTLESERSRCQREKQSADQRCLALEKLYTSRENEHQSQIRDLTDRANAAELQSDISLSAQQELRRKVSALEGKLLEAQEAAKEMTSKSNKTIEKFQIDLNNARQENELLSIQIPKLRNQLEHMQLDCRKEKENGKLEVQQRLQQAQVEVEAMRIAQSNHQIMAKEAQQLHEKAVALHQSTIDQMKLESKSMRLQFEKVISDERGVSQRLMAKIQELNQVLQSLTLERHESKLQMKGYIEKNTELERVLASGEVKLRNLGRQLSKSVEEQQQRIRVEAELKTELHQTRAELEKSRNRVA